MAERLKTLEEFWPFYVREHSKRATRRMHFAATLLAFLGAIYSVAAGHPAAVLVSPVLAYGIAWCSHFFVERNFPATFRYPLWSLVCDLRMFVLMLSGRMDAELARLLPFPD